MEKFIKENRFKLIVILIIVIFIVYGGVSSKLYKNNSECAQEASSYAKNRNDSSSSLEYWQVLQSNFIKSKGACIAEFSSETTVGKHEFSSLIYDLTHSKELATLPDPTSENITLYTRDQNIYKDIKAGIFGE